ncbi:MAG: hypothetical protein IKD68_00580, partial [Solobacterium sp.]|nr:hypothetical protein [Solobacterium sp.]
MAQTKNRGRFGNKIGRPTRKMLEELNREKQYRKAPENYLSDIRNTDVRKIDPEKVMEYEAGDIDNSLPLDEWMSELVRRTGNPFVFKTKG